MSVFLICVTATVVGRTVLLTGKVCQSVLHKECKVLSVDFKDDEHKSAKEEVITDEDHDFLAC